MASVWGVIARTSAARIYSLLLGIVALSVTAHVLGPEGRGAAATILALVELLSTGLFLSLAQVSLYRMSTAKDDLDLGELSATLLLLAFLLGGLGIVATLATKGLFDLRLLTQLPPVALAIGLAVLPLAIWDQYGSALLTGLGKIDHYNALTVVTRSLSTGLSLVCVLVLDMGATGLVLGYAAGQVALSGGSALAILRHVRANGLVCRPSWTEARRLLAGGARLHLNALGGLLFTSAGVLVVSHYRGVGEAGWLQLAQQLVNTVMLVPAAAGTVVYAKIAAAGPDDAWPVHYKLLQQSVVLVALAAAVLGATAPWWMVIIAGSAFLPAAPMFQIMCIGLIGATISTILGPQWVTRGYLLTAAVIQWCVGLVGIAITIWLVRSLGGTAAAVSYSAVYLLALIANGWMIRHCQARSGHQR
jgi:O-antigen/teichoic acid export membrane protein